MLNDVAIEIADEVVNDLNAQLFSIQFTAERHYLPKFELERNATPVVAVAPRDVSSEQQTRDTLEERWGLDIGVLARVKSADPELVDPLMALVTEIRGRYSIYRTIGGRGVSFEPASDVLYDRDWLEQKHQFAGVIQLSFQIERQLYG